jgi:uncharacterized membrane protein
MTLEQSTLGERLADKIARFGGSWLFLGTFGLFMLVWMGINSCAFIWTPADPYPFIFLNLLLSCLAAVQAPVIMMSQNRKETLDRQRAEQDYEINLKAEREILSLHQKIDELLVYHKQMMRVSQMNKKEFKSSAVSI